eukprot:TRINITY_DN12423_c0_g2_i1.p1 TRINITY_DN12423_c0_g2~~TRINITY_DN12423_c0_g2_i1.p1  ORF type:complete len:479 (+),score=107.70 TRINITY_DN12423_c0_g2_i1:155-1591(+)
MCIRDRSMLSAQQNIVWLSFGSIPDQAAIYYGVDKYWILNVLPALGGFIYLPCAPCTAWAIDRFSISTMLKLGSLVMAVATCLRLQGSFAAVAACAVLNAMLGPVVMTSPPRVSAEFFDGSARTTATAISYGAQTLGLSAVFLWSPHQVHSPGDIQWYMGVQAILCCTTCVLFLTFPSAPAPAPSAVQRVGIKQALVQLSRNWQFSLLAVTWGGVMGISIGWMALFNQILGDFLSDNQIGWIGFSGNLCGLVGGVLVGVLADRCKLSLKTLMLGLWGGTVLAFGLFLMARYEWGHSWWGLFGTASLFGLMLNASSPLVLEIGAEWTFPIPEDAAAGVLTMVLNLFVGCFTIAGQAVAAETLTYVLFGGLIAGFFVLLLLPYRGHRSEAEALHPPCISEPPRGALEPDTDSLCGFEEEQQLCVVCLDRRKDVFLVPCGHVCVCEPCASMLQASADRLCPLCRVPLQGFGRCSFSTNEGP